MVGNQEVVTDIELIAVYDSELGLVVGEPVYKNIVICWSTILLSYLVTQ